MRVWMARPRPTSSAIACVQARLSIKPLFSFARIAADRESGLHVHGLASSCSAKRPSTRVAAVAEDVELMYSGESFYDIFGVAPDAGAREIKLAYYGLMRECHPDQNGEDESTEFCKMLNDIYETLMDEERRALYDEIAGFSDFSVNPFLDVMQERDLVFVDEFSCIGCRNCNGVCPKTFTMEEEWGRARVMRQRVDRDEKLQEAIDTCPVSCIHWVSAAQLSLLEATMARMERVAVWSLMSGGGANRDVFTEASMAWEKRHAAMAARKAAAAAVAVAAEYAAEAGASSSSNGAGGGMWGNLRSSFSSFEGASGSRFYDAQSQASKRAKQAAGDGNGDAGNATSGSKEAKSIASLAARAARASRTWRVYQEVARAKRGALSSLSSVSSVDEADL